MSSFRSYNLSATLNVMIMAIQKASRGLVRDFGELEQLQVIKKGLGDFVSVADQRSERILIQELQKARPSYGFITEETGIIDGQDTAHTWIIDPLDGTTNFLHGVPHFCITVALKRDHEVIAGVTYDPIKDELYWAEKGQGAFMNQRRLRVANRRSLDEALIAFGDPYRGAGNLELCNKRVERVTKSVAGLRRFGAAALDLAYVASGRYDGYFEDDMKIWDIAAGILLVQEAGGFVSDISGGKDMLVKCNVLTANKDIHAKLLPLL